MTITTYGDDATAKQIIRQVNKVQEVVASGPEGRGSLRKNGLRRLGRNLKS